MVCRTLCLTEYQPREVRLRRDEVDALLATDVFEVLPVRQHHRYRVRAQGVAGLLLIPNLRVVIRPKIPKANLYLLLDPDAPPDVIADSVAAESGTEAIDFLSRRLADAMRERAARGLPRTYFESSDRLPCLRGRLDVGAQSRESPAGRAHFHVTHDEYTTDNALHRFVKATAESLIASPLVAAATRSTLWTALADYADVTSVRLDRALSASLPADRLDKPDQSLIHLSRLLAFGLQPNEQSGSACGPAFLVNLEQLFERYVQRGLRADLPVGEIDVQREFAFHHPVPAGQPAITGRPDVVIRRNGQVMCVIDAKWKSLDGSPQAGDVHQVLAYATGLGCKDVRLVYPGRRSTTWRYELSRSDVRLAVHTLQIVGARDKCEASMRKLVRAIRT